MIRFEGVETVHGHARAAVFAAGMVKANWPAAAGVRIGPEEDLLVEGGRVRASLELPGVVLSVAGAVTRFEPSSQVEASGRQAGIWAATSVSMADNADRTEFGGDVSTTVAWRFEARLPLWLAVFELPATVAIRVAIPVLRERFIENILRYLEEPVAGAPARAARVGRAPAGRYRKV